GNVDNGSTGTAPVGTINPGDNTTATPAEGVLSTSTGGATEKWGSGTNFHVDLNDPNASGGFTPGPGFFDQLVVNGNLNLRGNQVTGGLVPNGGATLTGTVGANVHLGDSFTILQVTGSGNTIQGVFNEPYSNNVIFFGTTKFQVQYLPAGNPTSVVLTRV